MKLYFILLAGFLYININNDSLALPKPLSQQELFEKSDVIIKGKVIKIDEVENNNIYEKYTARIQILEVIKGDISNTDIISVFWKKYKKKLLGNWYIEYALGEVIETHLIWDQEEKMFKTISWNGSKVIVK
jgi:hypothetical protein